ncbi:response regulator [Brevundimonas vesicularis]|uniref:response regulator n=1 Tax=Brevundimonas vesicularis TaxID=41276 RepID=UPI0038D4CF8E
MAPTATRASDPWIAAIRLRTQASVYRMFVGIVAAVIFGPLLGWQACLIWLACYLIVQEVERVVFRPVLKSGATPLSTGRSVLGHMVLTLNASLYGIIAIPSWISAGPMGGVAASVLLSAGMIISVVTSSGSLRVFVCTVVPQWAILCTTPFFMAYYGASTEVIMATVVSIAACGYFSLTTRTHLFQARRAEHYARVEADRKRQEAERAMDDRSAFLAAVAHDLRTPISAILTGAAKVEESDNPAIRRQHVALISDASRMMRDLLDDLLDHARLEAGRMSIESQTFDARLLLSQTARLWQAPVKAKGLKLRLEGSRTVPRYLRGDPMRLRQILNNLISNALKFTDAGSITLRFCAWSSDSENEQILLIDIADTGAGMTPQQMARLFVPYDQTADGIAARFGGSGLGLAISRDLVELMGGRLTVRSEPGKGSVFTLSLTLEEAAPEHLTGQAGVLPPASVKPVEVPVVPAASCAAEASPSLRVLVVDDHAINRRAIQLILQPLNCEITMAENGRDALDLCQAQGFDVIFMDVRMPELDGRETTRRLRTSGGINAAVPVIAVTADNAREDVQACTAAGMTGFVSKPLTPATLLTALQETLAGAGEAEETRTSAA